MTLIMYLVCKEKPENSSKVLHTYKYFISLCFWSLLNGLKQTLLDQVWNQYEIFLAVTNEADILHYNYTKICLTSTDLKNIVNFQQKMSGLRVLLEPLILFRETYWSYLVLTNRVSHKTWQLVIFWNGNVTLSIRNIPPTEPLTNFPTHCNIRPSPALYFCIIWSG